MFVKLLCSIAIGLIAGAVLLAATSLLRKINTLTASQLDSADKTPASYNPAVRCTAPAVVNVYNRSMNSTVHNQLEIRTLGSGVIMGQCGYIITNKYVINNADQIIVASQDGRVSEALFMGSNTSTDLVVPKINATGGPPTIPISNKRVPYIGDVILTISNSYSLGQTIIQGIIGATGRISLNPIGWQNLLQTDAPINHGNSGGALVNPLDESMGINTLSFDKSNDDETPEGIGFAIPFQLMTKVMDKLTHDERVICDYVGISSREVTPLHAQDGGMDQIQGVVVNEVTPDDPTTQASIQINDLIILVNNRPAVSTLETMGQVVEIRPGSVIPIVMMCGDKQSTLQAMIQEYPATN